MSKKDQITNEQQDAQRKAAQCWGKETLRHMNLNIPEDVPPEPKKSDPNSIQSLAQKELDTGLWDCPEDQQGAWRRILMNLATSTSEAIQQENMERTDKGKDLFRRLEFYLNKKHVKGRKLTNVYKETFLHE